MNLATYPSLMFDTRILENGIIKIPELKNRYNQDVHVVVIFKQNKHSENKQSINLAGSLKKYAKPELIENETELAWSTILDN